MTMLMTKTVGDIRFSAGLLVIHKKGKAKVKTSYLLQNKL